MSVTLDRFAGHRYAPGYERLEDPTIVDGFATFGVGLGEFWPAIALMGLLYVVLARSARRRRVGTNSRLIRQLEREARQTTFRQIGTDLRLRHEAGDTGNR